MMKSFLSFMVAAVMFSTTSAQATWKVDKSHSNVDFTVTHLIVSEVRGSFKEFDATFTSEKPDFSDMKLEATIKTASVFTDNENRDNHLRSNDFFNADSFKTITFKSTSVKKTGKDTYAISGNLTIRDITKPVVLDTKFRGTVVDPWGNTKAGFVATTKIDRFAFGTTWDKKIEAGGLVVGKEVEIKLLMEFGKQKAEEKK
jgi:polyisoprenoid-binding protein YceI